MARPTVYLTSFFDSLKLPAEVIPLSAAVYQPKGFKYLKVGWCDIRDANGKWIRPREFLNYEDPAAAYWDAMLEHYEERDREITDWLELYADKDVALCCWCPHDKAAQRQLKEFDSFICHTGPIGHVLSELYDVTVYYDEARTQMYRGGYDETT